MKKTNVKTEVTMEKEMKVGDKVETSTGEKGNIVEIKKLGKHVMVTLNSRLKYHEKDILVEKKGVK